MLAKTLRNQARLLEASRLTEDHARHWAAAFKNGESYEADSSNRTHTGSFWSTKPEAGIAERCPMHATHTQMMAREKGMGFSQTARPTLPIELKWGVFRLRLKTLPILAIETK